MEEEVMPSLRTLGLMGVLLATLPLLGPPPAARAAEPSATPKGGIITRAVLASAVTPLTRSPLGVTDTFPPDLKAVHVNIAIANAPRNTAIRVDWIAVDVGPAVPRNTKIFSASSTVEGSTTVSEEFFVYPQTPGGPARLPIGAYRMDIYVNDKLDRTLKMTIRENVPAFVPPPLRAIGSCPPPTKPVYRPPLVARALTPAQGVTSAVEPINPTREFKPTSKFYVIAHLDNPPPNSKVKAVWYALDTGGAEPCNTRLGETEITTSSARAWFNWSAAPKKFPVGIYRVEIYVNGSLNNDVDLRVFE
jgi:hypothetical protein